MDENKNNYNQNGYDFNNANSNQSNGYDFNNANSNQSNGYDFNSTNQNNNNFNNTNPNYYDSNSSNYANQYSNSNEYGTNNYYQNLYAQNQYNQGNPYQPELEEPVSVLSWIGTILLAIVPCVGLIVYIVWAFSAGTNKSKANYCKAQLILMLAIFIFYIVIAIIGVIIGFSVRF